MHKGCDAMKITKIQKLKSGKYKIELDQKTKITTYDDIILNNNLLFQPEMDTKLQNQIMKETSEYDSYYKALKYITTKMRSEKEMYAYLNKKEIPEEEQKKIIEKLKGKGLLNEHQFIVSFIADKVHLSNWGPNQIKRELENHDLNSAKIIEELNRYDDSIFEEKLRKIIQKRVSTNHKHSKYQLKQKLLVELMNLGYEKEQICSILESISYNDCDLLKKEYQLLYLKLSKKYTGNMLENQIKNKLYQKGFSLSDIQDLIELERGKYGN